MPVPLIVLFSPVLPFIVLLSSVLLVRACDRHLTSLVSRVVGVASSIGSNVPARRLLGSNVSVVTVVVCMFPVPLTVSRVTTGVSIGLIGGPVAICLVTFP